MSKKKDKTKIIVIVGPTASGKTSLSIELARKFSGEVISADSRQVYKGLNIGTGKVTKTEMRGIPHHLLDVASPRSVYTVTKFKRDAERSIRDIAKRGKVPIIAGGTGFYIDALVYNQSFPEVPPNKALRARLEKKGADDLFNMLIKLDTHRARTIDSKNKRRLIRAIEIATKLGKVPTQKYSRKLKYQTLIIGIKTNDVKLKKKITTRLASRMRAGMVAEAKRLHAKGLSWKRMESLGLEYRYVSRYLRGMLAKEEMIKQLKIEIEKYTKRQKTWFKRDKKIKWFELDDKKKIEKVVAEFLEK